MKGFIEHLCEHCFIIRVGPETEKEPDPYDAAVTFVKRSGDIAEARGFNVSDTGIVTYTRFNIIRSLVSSLGLKMKWIRFKTKKKPPKSGASL